VQSPAELGQGSIWMDDGRWFAARTVAPARAVSQT
jgi:hypothetical protein